MDISVMVLSDPSVNICEMSALSRVNRACLDVLPKIMAVGTGTSPNTYTQTEMLDLFQIKDSRLRSLFLNSAIERRNLTLPQRNALDGHQIETQGELIRKHRKVGIAMGCDAIRGCLEQIGASRADVRYICCVSSTGFITPGFSALLIKEMELSDSCSRLDIVGMGCNAGLNGLAAVSHWASMHPGQLALLVCVEVCSAAYVFDDTMRTAVVNSLFGDGAASAAICADTSSSDSVSLIPSLLHFSSLIIPSAIDTMRYDWDEQQGRFSFFLDPEVPYIIGAHAEKALKNLLNATNISCSQIKHWIIHSGGKKVIDSVRVNLGLTRHDVRHTVGVLRDHGNLSSGSFLFSYERLLRDSNTISKGDYAVMMTMGPGATIEMALLRWC